MLATDGAVTTQTSTTSRRTKFRNLRNSDLPILIALLVLVAYFAIFAKGFLTPGNLSTILSQISILGIAAVGQTMVILIAGIDLSNGAILALAGVVTTTWALKGLPVGLAMLSTVLLGLILGWLNGLAIYKLRMAAFIVTLAMMSAASGLALVYTNGQTVFGFPNGYNFLGSGKILGIPVSILLLLIVFIIAWFVLNNTSFGRNLYALGGNLQAAKLSGVRVDRVGIIVFALSGALAGLASLIEIGRLASAVPIAGQDLNLQTIAAVVIGGTSLFGGVGRITGTFIGVLLIGVLNNGLAISNVSAFWDTTIQGIVIFLAVLIDATMHRNRN
ncbi:ribose ABC transporter permease [Alicyclobacillus tolerans]|uniref:ABC transporter permease n=1 Tax=Alicyclobacillus tolerans TaxID=90970 RepID=UPI001F2AC628|nr:ribose ABC transporter permease [Alicyclobacillus tolerans]MCF8567357.1 ribose ABC transporter permease [Alicyclobacillus tolerans]